MGLLDAACSRAALAECSLSRKMQGLARGRDSSALTLSRPQHNEHSDEDMAGPGDMTGDSLAAFSHRSAEVFAVSLPATPPRKSKSFKSHCSAMTDSTSASSCSK